MFKLAVVFRSVYYSCYYKMNMTITPFFYSAMPNITSNEEVATSTMQVSFTPSSVQDMVNNNKAER